jgi:uncharacterized protein
MWQIAPNAVPNQGKSLFRSLRKQISLRTTAMAIADHVVFELMQGSTFPLPVLKKSFLWALILFMAFSRGVAQPGIKAMPQPGYELRIQDYVNNLEVIDTHEHLYTEQIIRGSYFSDFWLLFQPNVYDDLVSAGLPGSGFEKLYNSELSPLEKWNLIEEYWNKCFNTSFSRTMLLGIKNLYGFSTLDANTVRPLSEKIRKVYSSDWFDKILRDSCNIKYVLQDGYYQQGKDDYFRYARRFEEWLNIKSTYGIDSIAISQLEPIYTLEDFVKSIESRFKKEENRGMAVVKVFISYTRSLEALEVSQENARKVFRKLVNENEGFVISPAEAKPLQDYMLYRLLELAGEHHVPVAFHTGIQAGKGNFIKNSNPALLYSTVSRFPGVNFILYHGGYPFGGELSVMAKTFSNVYIDMNWTWSISPSYSERYLSEWLETVPAGKLMAFGGDCMVVENVYSELLIAREIISKVLCEKVSNGYLTEPEAKSIAKMILFDNAARVYKLEQ